MDIKKMFTGLATMFLVIPGFCFAAQAQETRYYVVTAYNDYAESGYSNEVSCDIEKGKIATLAWNPALTATGYKVSWSKTSGGPYQARDVGQNTTHVFMTIESRVLTVICE